MFSSVKPLSRVLLIWSDLGSSTEELQSTVKDVQKNVGDSPKVCVENIERLALSGYNSSSFDLIYSGCIGLATVNHELDLMAEIAKLLVPGGEATVVQTINTNNEEGAINLKSTAVLAGLAVLSSEVLPESSPSLKATAAKLGKVQVVKMTVSKPQHEVGSSRLLSFAKPAPIVKNTSTSSGASKGVWTLEDIDDETVELVDDKTLLSEEDLTKPDPATLRVCGTTGKRKACKDCSCGLKEELSDGKEPVTKSVTSSCGSCYLGDAFRCGSCPYLGMPAFKPGEKITLSDRQLNPDLREVV